MYPIGTHFQNPNHTSLRYCFIVLWFWGWEEVLLHTRSLRTPALRYTSECGSLLLLSWGQKYHLPIKACWLLLKGPEQGKHCLLRRSWRRGGGTLLTPDLLLNERTKNKKVSFLNFDSDSSQKIKKRFEV